MQAGPIGHHQLNISRIGFGCGPSARLMVGDDEQLRLQAVSAALRGGIDYFDTAAAYGDGLSERNLGRALATVRNKPTVMTKVFLEGPDLTDIKTAVIASVEKSLARTQVSKFGGVLLHNRVACQRDTSRRVGLGSLLSVDDVLGPGGVVEGLKEQRAAGKIDAIGFTTLGGERAAIEDLIASKSFDFINAQYGLLGDVDRDMPEIEGGEGGYDVIGRAAALGLAVIAIRVLGSGLILRPREAHRRMVTDLGLWSKARGTKLTQVALRFALSRPEVTSLVVGFSHPDHVMDAALAMRDGPLSETELAEIAAIRAQGRRQISSLPERHTR